MKKALKKIAFVGACFMSFYVGTVAGIIATAKYLYPTEWYNYEQLNPRNGVVDMDAYYYELEVSALDLALSHSFF
jgi:hypothetical protein